MTIRITGLNSGLDTESIISALVSSYNYKVQKYQKAQTKLSWTQDAWKALNTKVYSLYSSMDSLRFSSGYNLKKTTVSDTTKASVTASTTAPNGTQTLAITKMAQAGYLTGGKLYDSTTTSTTLAELGYTGGDGKITLTKGDGTTTSISVSQSTTVSSFLVSLKSAGLTANYDDTNKRIFVSSSSTGKSNDFTLTGANVDGANALYSLGLNVQSSASTATYASYTKYYGDGTNNTKTTQENLENGIDAYKEAYNAYNNAKGENANLTAAYSYATAYAGMQDVLENSDYGLSSTQKTQLKSLLLLSSDERSNGVVYADNIYTQSGTDDDGNAIYKYENVTNNTTSYLMRVDTYSDATPNSSNTFTKNADGNYEDGNGNVYIATGEADDNGNPKYSYTADDGTVTTVAIKTTSNYYQATATTTTDADGTETTTYAKGSAIADPESAATVLKEIEDSMKSEYQTKNPDDSDFDIDSVISTLTSNISTVNSYETGTDSTTGYTDTDNNGATRNQIITQIQSAYESGYTPADSSGTTYTGSEAVSKLANTFADHIAANKTIMSDSQKTMDKNSVLASIATMDSADPDYQTNYSSALSDLVSQVDEAYKITSDKTIKYNSDAKKIDGSDSEIYLNGVKFTSTLNSFSINGLSITVTGTTGDDPDNDYITINTATDTQGIYDKIKDFLSRYNTLINEMTSLYNADSAKGYEPLTDDEKDAMSDTEIEKWETKIKDSLLRRDTTLSSIMSAMTSAMSSGYKVTVNGQEKTYYLSNFGIKTLGYLNAAENEYNAYHIDGDEDDTSTSTNTDKLMSAITSDPDSVISFMQQLANGLYTAIGDKMKSTSLSSSYKIYNDKEMASEYSDYTTTISKWEEKLEDYEDYWYDKFSSMETALAKLNSQTSSLSSMMGG